MRYIFYVFLSCWCLLLLDVACAALCVLMLLCCDLDRGKSHSSIRSGGYCFSGEQVCFASFDFFPDPTDAEDIVKYITVISLNVHVLVVSCFLFLKRNQT